VTLSNSGVTALNITSIGLTGAYASSYLMSQNCPATLAAGASCTIRLRFNPQVGITPAVTLIPASLTIADDAPNSPQSVSLTGAPQAIAPAVTWGQPGPITYGTALSGTQLNATSSVAGAFSYKPAAGTVLGAGVQTLTATFTPSDTTHYIPATASVNLTVSMATPAISWTPPAAIAYGTALSGTQLNATSSVAGTFSYKPAAGAVLGAGVQTLTATFTPIDATDYGAATASVSVTVTKATTTPTVTVTPSALSVSTAQSLSVTVAVSGGSGNPTPTGSAILAGGGYTSAAAPLSSGSAIINIPALRLAAGTDTLTATYTPDSASSADYNGATGTGSLTVISAPSFTLSPKSTAVNLVEGSNSADTLTLTPANGFAGSVMFSVTGLPNGVTASFSPNPTTADSIVLTLTATGAAVIGDPATVTITGTSGSLTTSTTISVTVTSTSSLLTPTVKVNPAINGVFDSSQSEAIMVSVSGTGAAPTGTVTLSGAGYTSSTTALSSGSAVITIPSNTFSTSGNVTLTASYSGDSVYTTGSGTASVTVNPPYKLSTSTPSAVNPGSPATATITLSADPSYSGSVNLACALATSPSGASDLPTCSVASGSPVTVTNGVASGSATVTINTTAATSSSLDGHSFPAWLSASGGTALAFFVFFGIPARRRNWRNLVGFLVLTVALGTLSACGAGGSGSGGGGGGNPGTTGGTYTFTVSSTGTPDINPAPSVTITLTVN